MELDSTGPVRRARARSSSRAARTESSDPEPSIAGLPSRMEPRDVAPAPSRLATWPAWLAIVWAIGVLIGLLRVIRSEWSLRRAFRESESPTAGTVELIEEAASIAGCRRIPKVAVLAHFPSPRRSRNPAADADHPPRLRGARAARSPVDPRPRTVPHSQTRSSLDARRHVRTDSVVAASARESRRPVNARGHRGGHATRTPLRRSRAAVRPNQRAPSTRACSWISPIRRASQISPQRSWVGTLHTSPGLFPSLDPAASWSGASP